jgi:MFS superfamily sulfate permease-like transporter
MSIELNPSLATSAMPLDKTAFLKDFSASLVVFLVALPLCMGIALASGMSPAAGLVTGIIGGLVVALLQDLRSR